MRQTKKFIDRKDARKFFKNGQKINVECHSIDTQFRGLLLNISSSAVFINTKKALPVGQEVAMTFTLPGSKETVKATGEIIRSNSSGIAVKIKLLFKK
jgi:Tfp pilus assembly protein PilZ